jgi:uncharacterized protein with GYD domain
MHLFLIRVSFSTGSWARMLKSADYRTAEVGSLMESLGGSLDHLYWDVDSCDSYAIALLPDSVTAAAVNVAVSGTGAYKSVETHELLGEEQLRSALALAKDASGAYRLPGQSAVEPDW